ncbi:hypothetical protein RhiirC2_47691 [Rhizophagus irregularis]|uniref:Uncharacterized protein n=1 Tax=Rhizophagus irregularis TaxID=588596 RepID=A0A2N1NV23_9GLOM|nr:hypothetical protein RhiirC2_47691 [Rhizophagus irregularis]
MPKEHQPHILRTITEVPARWESALASWRRLRELKPAIRRVLVNLSIKSDYQSKKDYRQLQELMLNTYYEWNLLDKLISCSNQLKMQRNFWVVRSIARYITIFNRNFCFTDDDERNSIDSINEQIDIQLLLIQLKKKSIMCFMTILITHLMQLFWQVYLIQDLNKCMDGRKN